MDETLACRAAPPSSFRDCPQLLPLRLQRVRAAGPTPWRSLATSAMELRALRQGREEGEWPEEHELKRDAALIRPCSLPLDQRISLPRQICNHHEAAR